MLSGWAFGFDQAAARTDCRLSIAYDNVPNQPLNQLPPAQHEAFKFLISCNLNVRRILCGVHFSRSYIL
jgi:hypothetical protein